MENKSNTRTKKLPKQVAVKVRGNTSLATENVFLQFFLPDEKSEISVQLENNTISASFSHNDFFSRPILLKNNLQNMSSLAKLIDEYKQIKKSDAFYKLEFDPKKERRAYNNAQNKFDQLIKKSGPLKQILSPLSDLFGDDQEIEQLFDELHTIESILPQILQLSGFHSYQAVQLVIHEKGKTEAESLHLVNSLDVIHSSISSKKFNVLFNHFKKSKNKIFNQNQILDENLFIVGPFLAKELELKEHNIIFIISRNGFLSPSEFEINYFNNLYPSLKQVFTFLLTKSKLTDRDKFLSLSINNYPFAMIISVGENIIFKNKLVTNEHIQLIHEDGHDYHHINLGSDKHLYLFPNNTADIISDLNHHQRVSLLGELLNTLKHELSNPLFGLKLTADILESEESNEEAQEMLHSVSDYALRCQKIIDNFSGLYLEHDQWTEIDLGHLIKEVITLTKSETRGIPVIFQISNDQQFPKVKTQATLLSQIVFNLVVNSSQAIKSTQSRLDQHSIKIELTELSDRFSITVTDTGPGITPEIREQIFRPYFTTKDKGTGLGLSICRNLSQKLGYSLEYQQNPFPGATFSIVLPKKF